ncbi:vasopressin V2 receptor isoform X1 [Pangasianodon hypophthalmus]|uniref:vasopressin V2 receptor isoform X1 n=1 Tax=Pangasianodon hypophthalmus TaxID=310915 RepID=UPI002307B3A6|nr:vasopressin V2 receptor isoform X1 [Pangasianodon hypophthalmus]
MTAASWEGDSAQSNRSLFNLNSSFSSNETFLWLLPSQNSTEVTWSPTPQPGAARVRDQALAQAEIGVLSLVLALTTLGNSFVLWVLLRRRKHHAPMHLFMINLCVADLVVAFFQVLPQLLWDITERFQGPDALCRFVKYLQIVGMFASSYMIVAMTVDRHYAICCPLQAYRGGKPSRWNTPIMVAWGLALLLSLPQVFIFSQTEVSPGEFECWGHFIEPWGLKAYVTWMTIAVFILPALIITVCQVRIFREIHDNIYLKSERMVTAEFKRNSVVFHFPQKEGHHGRSGRERDSQGSHNHQTDIHGCHCSNSTPTDLQSSYDDLSSPEPFGNSTYNPCDSFDPCSVPLPSTEISTSTSLPLEKFTPDLSDPSHAHALTANSACAQSRASSSLAGQLSGTPELWPDVLPDPPPPPPPGISKAMSKTVRMTLVIVLVYTICWAPFFIVQLWAAWDPNPPDQGVAFTILMLLASLNSCTNPWIYTAFSSSVSRELLALLRCHVPTPRRGSLPDDSTTTHTSTTTKDSIY